MKFVSWNVNGLRACLGKGFMDYFTASDADFFFFQETKMQPGQAAIRDDRYHQYWYSAEKKGSFWQSSTASRLCGMPNDRFGNWKDLFSMSR